MRASTSTGEMPSLNLHHFREIFPELPMYVFIAMFFADIGIILGATNAFRAAGFITFFQIHMTHWTSTLLGGLSILMLGQIWYSTSNLLGEKHPYHAFTIIPVILWILGMGFNYLAAWVDFNVFHPISFYFLISSITFYLFIFLMFFLKKRAREVIKSEPLIIFLFSALLWLWLGIFFFKDVGVTVNETLFIYSYIYGFFALTLFGNLYHYLPRLYDQKAPSTFTVLLNFVVSFSAALLLTIEKYLRGIGYTQEFWFVRLIGAALFGFGLLIFLLWLGDFIYRSGLSPSLGGLLVAMVIFGFFMFDTIMSAAFPQWVPEKHIHFMFLGALLLTIISIGTRIILVEFRGKSSDVDVKSWSVNEIIKTTPKIRLVSMAGAIISVGGIIFGFTIQVLGWFPIQIPYVVVGIFGIVLFISLIFVEISLALELKTKAVISAE